MSSEKKEIPIKQVITLHHPSKFPYTATLFVWYFEDGSIVLDGIGWETLKQHEKRMAIKPLEAEEGESEE